MHNYNHTRAHTHTHMYARMSMISVCMRACTYPAYGTHVHACIVSYWDRVVEEGRAGAEPVVGSHGRGRCEVHLLQGGQGWSGAHLGATTRLKGPESLASSLAGL